MLAGVNINLKGNRLVLVDEIIVIKLIEKFKKGNL